MEEARVLLLRPEMRTAAFKSGPDGRTALMVAAIGGHGGIVRQLLRHSDIDARDPAGQSALTLAINAGQAYPARVLIEASDLRGFWKGDSVERLALKKAKEDGNHQLLGFVLPKVTAALESRSH